MKNLMNSNFVHRLFIFKMIAFYFHCYLNFWFGICGSWQSNKKFLLIDFVKKINLNEWSSPLYTLANAPKPDMFLANSYLLSISAPVNAPGNFSSPVWLFGALIWRKLNEKYWIHLHWMTDNLPSISIRLKSNWKNRNGFLYQETRIATWHSKINCIADLIFNTLIVFAFRKRTAFCNWIVFVV